MTTPTDWMKAHLECREQGSDLVMIETRKQSAYLHNYIKGAQLLTTGMINRNKFNIILMKSFDLVSYALILCYPPNLTMLPTIAQSMKLNLVKNTT